jgi:hypothetical protein
VGYLLSTVTSFLKRTFCLRSSATTGPVVNHQLNGPPERLPKLSQELRWRVLAGLWPVAGAEWVAISLYTLSSR